jgi:RNA polymerase sigma-70 factor (ECF subfamily)
VEKQMPTKCPNKEEFLLSMAPRLRRYLHVLTGSLHDAEDALQEVFMKYLQKGPAPGTERAERWLFRVSRNHVIDAKRGNARRQRREQAYAEAEPGIRPPNPMEAVARGESLEKIEQCLMKLPIELREILILKVVEETPYSRLARLFGIAKSTASSRVGKALTQLNRCFHGRR